MAKTKEVDSKVLETALKNLSGFLQSAGDVKGPEYISTGHFQLDLAIGQGVDPESEFDMSKMDSSNIGGFPLGKIVEIFGPEGSGKSSLAHRVVGMSQKKGYKCAWIDAERSYSPGLADLNGVDRSKLDFADLTDIEDPNHLYSAEEVFDRICDLCVAGYKTIVLDSVANLTTRTEMDNNIADGGVGMAELARVLSKSLKKVINYAAKYNVLIVIINQIRDKVGVMFGNPETTMGGRALRFLASVRIRVQKKTGKDANIESEIESLDGEVGKSKKIGGFAYVSIAKNRFSMPIDNSIMIPIYYIKYFPNIEEVLFDEGRRLKIIGKHLKSFRWNDVKIEGRSDFISHLKKNNLIKDLVEELKSVAKEQKVILAPEVLYYDPEEAKYEEETRVEEKDEEKLDDKPKILRNREKKDNKSSTGKSVE